MSRVLRRAQRGVVLFIALIVLVAMSLAGIALIRGVDTGSLVAGNLAFRQSAAHVGDLGVEAARAWLLLQTASLLYNPLPASAYHADWSENIRLVGTPGVGETAFDWSTALPLPVTSPAPPAGYSVSYVIHRLCQGTGDPATATTCARQVGSAAAPTSGSKGAATFSQIAIQVSTSAMYRITVRVLGPRNSVSFVQAVIQ